MSALDRILGVLPPIYATAPDAMVTQLLNLFALECDVLQEDIERMRRTHWVNFVYRLEDLERLAALVGVTRYPWETPPLFRTRLLAHVRSLLKGALGPNEIKTFVYDYLMGVTEAIPGLTLIPGLEGLTPAQAFAPIADRPLLRPLALVENPPQLRRSATLLARGGRVPYLFRWEEQNRGLEVTVPTFYISGHAGGRTAVPLLVNLTTGELIGYAATLKLGQTLVIAPAGANTRRAQGTIDGVDVSARLFSVSGFRLGTPFDPADQDPEPLLPHLVRGANRWIFLVLGLYDVKGLDHFFFAIANESLAEGVFDGTFFDHALFPSGPVATLAMEWTDLEPASFEVRVPHHLVVEPGLLGADERPAAQVEGVLADAINALRGAGVRAAVRFVPFQEVQRQQVRVRYGWQALPPEDAPTGENEQFSFGALFGETRLGMGRLG